MKKFLAVLVLGVLAVSSIFAFGPARGFAGFGGRYYQPQATQSTTTSQTTQITRLYRNLPAGTTLSETQTFKATVKEYTFAPQSGFTLKVQIGDKVYDVHAGPIFKVAELKAGQSIEIVGKLATSTSGNYIVAEQVKLDGKSVDLSSLRGPKNGRGFGRGINR
ncbi:MAG: hypothetical protein ACUVQF_03315 [Fervidobacterium sp.]|uniref:hypothetical protein n=1 Tax=Fervidobacterium sp. TaxID=1871331 RepID=UPI0040492E65